MPATPIGRPRDSAHARSAMHPCRSSGLQQLCPMRPLQGATGARERLGGSFDPRALRCAMAFSRVQGTGRRPGRRAPGDAC